MAQLKDLLVNGVSRLVGDVFLDKLNAPTTSAGVDFGLGTNGQVLKTNGDNIYWDNALTIGYGDTINPYASKTKNYVLAAPNGSNGAPSFRSLVAADLPTVTVAKGGTGMTTATNKNAVVIGNSTTVTNAMQTVRTASGAFYATGQDAKPQFGTLPVAQGGTGVSTAATNTVFAGPVSGSNAAPSFRDLTIDDIKGLTIGYCDSAGTDTTKVIKLNIDDVNVSDQFIFYLKNNNSTSNSSSTNLSLTINNNINCDIIYDENLSARLKANATLPKGYYALRIVQKTGLWALKPIPIDYKSVPANTVFAGPVSGSDAAPSFRTLTFNDLSITDEDLPITVNRPYRLYSKSTLNSVPDPIYLNTTKNATTIIPFSKSSDEIIDSCTALLLILQIPETNYYDVEGWRNSSNQYTSTPGATETFKELYISLLSTDLQILTFENFEIKYYSTTQLYLIKSWFSIPISIHLNSIDDISSQLTISPVANGKQTCQNSLLTSNGTTTSAGSCITGDIPSNYLKIAAVVGI